jgi:hypothetical protein
LRNVHGCESESGEEIFRDFGALKWAQALEETERIHGRRCAVFGDERGEFRMCMRFGVDDRATHADFKEESSAPQIRSRQDRAHPSEEQPRLRLREQVFVNVARR